MPTRELPDRESRIALGKPGDLDRIMPLPSDGRISNGDAALAIYPSTAGATQLIGEDSFSFGQVQSDLPSGNVPYAPTAIATITSALDEFADPSGNHHDNVIQTAANC
jgi:hypothetical protein